MGSGYPNSGLPACTAGTATSPALQDLDTACDSSYSASRELSEAEKKSLMSCDYLLEEP